MSLRIGDSGPKVLAVQQRLSELGYWLGTPDGQFGALTQQAVYAIQKAAGLSRDGAVGPKTQAALGRGVRPAPKHGGNGVEIDLKRQLLLVVRDGKVRTALNTSTGNGERYVSGGTEKTARTPRGTFAVNRVYDGMSHGELGDLFRPRYFYKGWAVHGSSSIPPYPASHGCARVSHGAINMIWSQKLMPMGSRVIVY